jgi:hypothetical protein
MNRRSAFAVFALALAAATVALTGCKNEQQITPPVVVTPCL